MTDTLEKRVGDLEALVGDIPEMINLRLERIDSVLQAHTARFDEMAGRLNLLDRQMGMITRDMRDMRGGVTRQLVEQDNRLASIERKLDEILARLPQA